MPELALQHLRKNVVIELMIHMIWDILVGNVLMVLEPDNAKTKKMNNYYRLTLILVTLFWGCHDDKPKNTVAGTSNFVHIEEVANGKNFKILFWIMVSGYFILKLLHMKVISLYHPGAARFYLIIGRRGELVFGTIWQRSRRI